MEVPFGNRRLIGVVVDDVLETDKALKSVSRIFNLNIGSKSWDFLKWVASYTLIPRGNVLKMVLAERTVFSLKKTENAFDISQYFSSRSSENIKLNEEQLQAYRLISESGSKPVLLQGVTGSGKTEIYLSAVRDAMEKKRQVLILFPEIALTQQISERIKRYFGFYPYVWNSAISPKKRRITWHGAISGDCPIIIGARSSLFLPFKNLGLIVVDEEHDSSYKQEEGGFYNARDMAVVLAHLSQIPLILSSATPSLESYVNAISGKYAYSRVMGRFGASKMPSIQLIDMRQNKFDGFISPILLDSIKKTIQEKQQCLIYLNRRGYSPVILCRSCGEKVSCPNCTSWLVYHKGIDRIVCHHCGHKVNVPRGCQRCGAEDSFIPFGPGVERIFDELKEKLPSARIEIASSDTISSAANISTLFEKIHKNEVDIVIGTQILAKGHHFPDITLVGVVDGDLGLNSADLRASEKTYQMISQVSGRAGRAEKPGKILIQTFNSNHSLYTALQTGNLQKFIDLEISCRKENNLPPFSSFASIIISGINRELTEKVAKNLAKSCPKNIKMFGPAPAPFFLLQGRARWRILLKASKKNHLSNLIRGWIFPKKIPKNVKIQIDMDPTTFL